jgi:predicted TIM-barrel fold metal-dependent hydrolase
VARNIIRENHIHVACQTDDDLPYVLKYAGEENIVIGSDYGHNDTSSEIEALRLLKKKGEVEPRIIDKILYDNAKALYGL